MTFFWSLFFAIIQMSCGILCGYSLCRIKQSRQLVRWIAMAASPPESLKCPACKHSATLHQRETTSVFTCEGRARNCHCHLTISEAGEAARDKAQAELDARFDSMLHHNLTTMSAKLKGKNNDND